MIEIKGKYTSAIVYTVSDAHIALDKHAMAQIQMLCDMPCCVESKIRVMPDVHAGKVGPIGLTMTVNDKVMPAIVSGDIGCGVTVTEIRGGFRHDFTRLDSVIKTKIPSGAANRKEPHQKASEIDLSKLCCGKHIEKDRAYLGLGTLGGGNHFIEVETKSDAGNTDKCLSGHNFLVIHSGSRNLGQQVCDYYMKVGQKKLKIDGKIVPYELTWLESDLASEYFHDIQIVYRYAELNRRIIQAEIFKGMKWKIGESFSSVHNYISDDRILRKGAVSAKEGEQVIIPVNMAQGCLIGIGKGNPEWNISAPHGSGRILMRTEVKSSYTVSQYRKTMKNAGVYSSSVGEGTLDEAPFAYRNIENISEAANESVEFTGILCPVYNFKAGGE